MEETMACILNIDDDAVDRKVLRKMLEDAGYHILEASDGEAGLVSKFQQTN
jgi:CheY-like chemotaxis protein